MRILYLVHQFYPEFYTGTEKFLLNMARMQQLAGHTVKVVTYSLRKADIFNNESGDFLYNEYVHSGVEVLAFRHKQIPDEIHGKLDLPECKSFAHKVLTDFSPDIIHVGHLMRVVEIIKEAKSLNIPYIMTLTDFWMFCHKGIMLKDDGSICAGSQKCSNCADCAGLTPNQKLERYLQAETILKGAAFVASPSQFLADMFHQEFDDLKVNVINHGMNYSFLQSVEKEYNNTDNTPLSIVFAGTFLPHKGVHVILRALSEIPNANVKLRIYGSGDEKYTAELKQMSDHRCEFMGTFNEKEVSVVLNSTDIVIIPSVWYENYPLVLHESFASHVPVIATGIGGMAEKIIDGKNGYTFAPGDSSALAKILVNILANREVLNSFKQNLRDFMVPTVEQEAWAYNRVYQNVLK